MEPPEAVVVQLSDVCRSCLNKSDDMTNFSLDNEKSTEILSMLSAVGNIEIELNEHLPSYLCKTCEEKLRLSYDFRTLILRSNEIIRECMNIDLVADETEKEGGDLEMAHTEEIKVESDPLFIKPIINSSRKLTEYSPEEVEAAINEYKEKFYQNTECIKCGFVTTCARYLSVHMAHAHKDMKENWCSYCNSEQEDMATHLLQHADNYYKCKFCGKKFGLNSAGHFLIHLRTHSRVKPHTCYICNRGFIEERHLDKHIRAHTNNRIYKCPRCPRNFSARGGLKIHLLDSHAEHSDSKIDRLCDNLEANSSSKPLQNFCKLCKRRVRSLEVHLEKFHNPNNTTTNMRKNEGTLCTRCGKKFSSLSRFRIHMRTHTGEAPYKCKYCDKRMTNRSYLVLHERSHTGEKPYVCTVCGRGFSQNTVLNTHMRIHTGRPVSCEICAKRFCRAAQLRLHMRQHTGEKPYLCTMCNQAFKQQSHLSEHLKRHSDERPYKCPHCDKSFKQTSTLKTHLSIHTGEKPFKCSQCPYASRQSHSLTQHMKKHCADAPNPDKPHICVLCQKGYSTRAMLMSHIGLAHPAIKQE